MMMKMWKTVMMIVIKKRQKKKKKKKKKKKNNNERTTETQELKDSWKTTTLSEVRTRSLDQEL